jgi:starch synthase
VAAERVKVVHNGIDPEEYFPDPSTEGLESLGLDLSAPYVLFVGRITRQKGITYLLEAARYFEPGAQVVLCAAAPDTPQIEAEVRSQVDDLSARRPGVVWVQQMMPRLQLVRLMSHAAVFVCPSVYEPFGLINIEAMSCGVPVVASAVGGIPEIVVDGGTGFLVSFSPGGDAFGLPARPAEFAHDLAERVNELLGSPEQRRLFGQAGRRRALAEFTWAAVAARTAALYREVLAGKI